MDKAIAVEVEILGVENSQYFQGFGTAYTEYTDSVVGAGDDLLTAMDDALEQIASMASEEVYKEALAQVEFALMPVSKADRTKTVLAWLEIPEEAYEQDDFDCDCYVYVGIRWKE